jgi:hypothetical protein
MDEAYILQLIEMSVGFGAEDEENIMAGFRHAQSFLRNRDDYVTEQERDSLVVDGYSTEFVFNCELKGRDSEEPIMRRDVEQKQEILISVGPEKTIFTDDIKVDRYTGFQAVAVAEKICKIKEILEDEGKDMDLIMVDDVFPLLGNYNKIDIFKPPMIESKIDDEMVSTFKNVYHSFLDTVISPKDKVIYMEGDFGSANYRRLHHVADCIFFDEKDYLKGKRNRKVNNTVGTDFYFSYTDVRWYEKLREYNFVIHNYLFGAIYEKLLEINSDKKFNMVAIGITPDRTDMEIYRIQKERSCLEAYKVEEHFAKKYGMQIMYEDELKYVVYFDHGRYEDIKPKGFELKIPFLELNVWKEKRCYRAFRHMSVYITGPLSVLISGDYCFKGTEVSIVKVRNEEVFLGEERINLPCIPNCNLLLLEGNIVDFDDPRPYWLRRYLLKCAGVLFFPVPLEEADSVIRQDSEFNTLLPVDQYLLLQEMIEKPIQPFFEVRGLGWNPFLKVLVYDRFVKSLVCPYVASLSGTEALRVSVDENQDGKMNIKEDPFGEFCAFTSVSYSEERAGVESRYVLDRGKKDVFVDLFEGIDF